MTRPRPTALPQGGSSVALGRTVTRRRLQTQDELHAIELEVQASVPEAERVEVQPLPNGELDVVVFLKPTSDLTAAALQEQKVESEVEDSPFLAAMTSTPISACEAPPIICGTKFLCPGASSTVKRLCSVAKNDRPTSTVLPLARSSSFVSIA